MYQIKLILAGWVCELKDHGGPKTSSDLFGIVQDLVMIDPVFYFR